MNPGKFISLLFIAILCSCNGDSVPEGSKDSEGKVDNPINSDEGEFASSFYYGADLSYVNEMLDCGANFKDAENNNKDPYKIFSEAGANLVRVRLWHNPTWTKYSNLEDVKQTIKRAREEGMEVLLDFHYSDTWTDPSQQLIPEAWKNEVNNKEVLGELLYNYTFEVLNDLDQMNLLPEIVQVGNEINSMILRGEDEVPMDWGRNVYLINKGIKAVRDLAKEKNKEIEVMIHIAQPENGLWWFKMADKNGLTDYDWIGLSFYPNWSDYTLANVSGAFKELIQTYNKRLMVVETAYPFTLENGDEANNILGKEALVLGIPATEEGQLDYLNQLKKIVKDAGGEGLIYWEPAWVSTTCHTLWGQGSHWDNATLFDQEKKANKGMSFYNGSLNN